MSNSTAMPSSAWYGGLTASFRENRLLKQSFYDFLPPNSDFSFLANRSTSARYLVDRVVAAHRDLLKLCSDHAQTLFCLALIFTFSFSTILFLLWRRLQKALDESKVRATEVKVIIQELQEARQLNEKLKNEADAQSRKLVKLQANLTQTQSSLTKQRNVHTQQLAQIKSLQNDHKKQKEIGQDLMIAAAKRNELVKRLQSDLLTSKATVTTQANLVKVYGQEVAGLAIENDLLKAIDGQVPNTPQYDRETFATFATPFVLVVIDGDAYNWNTLHFNQPGLSAGRHAANSIKIEVQQYMLQNKERIPLHAKIMTRVFTNLGENIHMRSAASSFPKQFNESNPLFDFVNCGSGKERADSKIQELVHLFVANEQCYVIFFAAVTDNGFARLLEQYACVPAAREKIILVDPGFVAYEIEDLQYNSVKWPAVFKHRSMGPESQAKRQRIKWRRKEDNAVLNAVAARELVARLTCNVKSRGFSAIGIGLDEVNWTAFRRIRS